MSSIYILWDESHIWGLLAFRAIEALGLPYRIVRAEDIAHGLLSSKPPALLLVPGGNARMKSEALGTTGIEAIRSFVSSGGSYLGFCGGAGLGLTSKDGLGLCPWGRAKFTDRMQHFVSGHIHTQPAKHALVPATLSDSPPLPIWWPGRFAPEKTGNVEVLATYTTPAEDFWVADLPLNSLPSGTFSEWETLYDIRLRPTFLTEQPCILTGEYGKGRYVLSYTHLETPESPEANKWLIHIIEQLSGIHAANSTIPAWDIETTPNMWEEKTLINAREIFSDIATIGQNHCLFFKRNSWLIGWRAGIPGANLNNLFAAISSAVSHEPTPQAQMYWQEIATDFMQKLSMFHEGAKGYLLAERLAMTLSKTFPETVSRDSLKDQRAALFGPPMSSGGLYLELLTMLDTLVLKLLPQEKL